MINTGGQSERANEKKRAGHGARRRKSSIKKDIRMQMRGEKRERKKEEGSADRESKGGVALTSKRAKRERESANGRDGGVGGSRIRG
jgi:hypothetical protein